MSATATALPEPTATIPALPPGPSLPRPLLVGRFLAQPTAFIESCQRRYGDYFTLRLSPERTMVISSDPGAVKTVFTADPEHLLAGKNNEILAPILGTRSVLLLDRGEHLRQRRLLLPPFHGERMKAYAETMREVAERHVAAWPRGSAFPTQPSMQAITLEVILRTVFGLSDAERIERVGAPLRRLLDATASQLRLFALQVTSSKNPRPGSPWGRFNALVAAADRVVYEEIQARRAQAGDGDHDDILSLLLAARDEEGEALTDLELRDELMTLLLAGHETTATALSWTLERLVRHPGVLEPARSRGARGRGGRLPRRCDQGDAAAAPGGPGGRPLPDRAAGARPPHPARGRSRQPLDLPPAPPPRPLPGPARLPPRALPRAAGRHLRVDPLRRRHPSLPRRELRPVRDEGRPAGDPRAGAPGAVTGRDERVTRRAITFTPGRGGRIAVEAAA